MCVLLQRISICTHAVHRSTVCRPQGKDLNCRRYAIVYFAWSRLFSVVSSLQGRVIGIHVVIAVRNTCHFNCASPQVGWHRLGVAVTLIVVLVVYLGCNLVVSDMFHVYHWLTGKMFQFVSYVCKWLSSISCPKLLPRNLVVIFMTHSQSIDMSYFDPECFHGKWSFSRNLFSTEICLKQEWLQKVLVLHPGLVSLVGLTLNNCWWGKT